MKRPIHLVIGVALALLLAACGDSSTTESIPADTAESQTAAPGIAEQESDGDAESGGGEAMVEGEFPAVVETADGEVMIEARPERIVSMSSTATEMLFSIGAGDQVVAVDSYSNYPADAPITDLSAFEASLEAIAVYDPDLVILGFDNPEIRDGMAAIDVPVMLLSPAEVLDDSYDQIAQLGEATGHLEGAAALNAEMRSGIEAVLAEVEAQTEPIRVYHEVDDTFYSASSASFLGQLYAMLGYENIADPADPDGMGFPQLQVDQIIAGDPTLIVFTNAYGYDATDIAERPGWDTLTAVSEGNILEVDTDVASRWGPRVVDFLQLIADRTPVPAG